MAMKTMAGVLLMLGTISAQAQDVDPGRISGRWAGTVIQKSIKKEMVDGQMQPVTLEEAYTMSAHITQMSEQEKSGTVWYPELGCRTELTLIHCADQMCKFAEIPDRTSPKTCVPDILTLQSKGRDKLLVQFYFKTNRQPMADATLLRVIPVEGKPAIEQ